MRTTIRLAAVAAVTASIGVALSAAPAAAEQVGTDDVKLTTGVDPRDVQVAYDPVNDRHLIVWDEASGAPETIRGQIVNNAGGLVSGPFTIGQSPVSGFVGEPAVTWDSGANRWWVAWASDDTIVGEREIYVNTVSAAGATGTQFRVSDMGDDSVAFDAQQPDIVYNATSAETLVVWRGDDNIPADGEDEIWGQRLSGTTEVGTNDFRISTLGLDGNTLIDARAPQVAWHPTANVYAVAFEQQDALLPTAIWVQLLSPAGAALGPAAAAATGTAGVTEPARATVAADDVGTGFLVAWEEFTVATSTGAIVGRTHSTGGSLGSPLSLSTAGVNSLSPDLTYNPNSDRYGLVFHADALAGPSTEFEIYGSLLTTTGTVAESLERLSTMGVDGTASSVTVNAAAAPGAGGRVLAVWQSDDSTPADIEVYGQYFQVNVPPTVTINQAIGQADPTNASPVSFTVVFSEPVVGFTNADISTAGSTATVGAIVVSGSGPTYTVTVAVSGNGALTASIPASAVTDAGGLANSASTSTDNTVTIDTTAPTVTINQAAGQADPTNSGTVDFTAVFSEPVAGFTAGDVSLAGSTATGGTVSIIGAGPAYTVRVSGVTGGGTVVVSIPASGATDTAGNGNAVSTSTDSTVTVDLSSPSVTIEQAVGQSDPTNTGPIAFTATFSETVTGFTAADVVLSASGAAGPLSATVTGTGPVYDVSVSGMTGDGTVIASIVAGAATDTAGNPSTVSTSTDSSVLYDAAVPTVTVAAVSADPTNANPVQFSVAFSEAVSGFTLGDIDFTGSTAGGTLAAAIGAPTGNTYPVTVTGMTSPGEVAVSIGASAVLDLAGNPNSASNTVSITWENVAPTVTVDQAVGQADPTNNAAIAFTVIASEPLTGLVAADFSVSNGTPTAVTPTAVSGVYTLTVTASGPGAVTASLPDGSATDEAGNGNQVSTSTDNAVTYDPTVPTVTIEQAAGQVDPTNTGPIAFTVVFSEPVTGFGAGDVDLSASTATGSLAAAVSGSGTAYTVTVSGMTGDGTVIASIVAGAATDTAGNPSTVSTSTDNTVRFDITDPSVGVGAAGGQASPTNTSPIEFIVVFSEPVTGFTTSDVSFTGSTTGGTLAAVVGAPTGNTYPVSVSGMAGSGLVQLSVPAGAAVDAAGNLTTVSGNVIVVYDVTDPVATISRAVGEPNPNKGPALTYSLTFTEGVTGVDAADFTITTTGTAIGTIGTVASSAADTYTVTVTSISGDGTLRLDLNGAGTGIVDAAGNAAGAATGEVFTIDAVAPTVTIDQATTPPPGQADPINAGPIQFTVTFSEPVNGFDTADVNLSSSTGVGSSLAASVSGSGASYTVSVSGMSGDGTVVAAIVAGGATDTAGNGNQASTSTDNSVDYDDVKPTVTVEQAAGQAEDVNSGPIEFTVTFSEPVTGFDATDVVLGGTAGPTTVSVSGSGPVFTLSVNGMATNGTVTATIPAGAATDLVGNASLASTSVDNSVNYAPGDPNPGANDAPVITAPVTSTAELGLAVPFTGGNAVSIADADAFGDPVQMTLTVTDGTITVPATAGVTITGSGTSGVTLVGPQSALNSALAAGSVTFTEVGSKTVVIGADDLGHSPAPALTATKTITFTVSDTTPPVITVPGASVLASSEPGKAGARVTFTVIVTDRGSAPAANPGLTQAAAPTFTCSPSSGSFFPIGTTTVTCTAQDSVGNTSTASFSVIVSDTEKPSITPPATQRATLPRGATTIAVTHPVPTAADNSGQVTVTCAPASGSAFAAGTTTVTCTATDPSGNTASASFSVVVTSGSLPPTGGGGSFVPAALATLLAGALLVLATHRRRHLHA